MNLFLSILVATAQAQTWVGEFVGTGVSASNRPCEIHMKIEDMGQNVRRLTFPKLVCHEEGFDLLLGPMLETDFRIDGYDMMVKGPQGLFACGQIDNSQMSCDRPAVGSFLSVKKANDGSFPFDILVGVGLTIKGVMSKR